jgi:hypothetical protein
VQGARQTLAHGASRRRRAIQNAVPASPPAETIPAAVAAPKLPLSLPSSLRSIVPSGAVEWGAVDSLVVGVELVDGLVVLVLDVVELELVDVLDVVVVDVVVVVVVVVVELAGAVGNVVVVAPGPGRVVGGGFGVGAAVGSAGGGDGATVVVLVGAAVEVVVVLGWAGAPQSPLRIGLGGWPSTAAGTSKRGGVAVPLENDQPSIEPGGGVREPAPSVE